MNYMVNFRIVESRYVDYDNILIDYQNTKLSVKEIREKHNIGGSTWNQFIKWAKSQGIPLRAKGGCKYYHAKNYGYDATNNKWIVSKRIHGKNYHFGRYKTEALAKAKVEELRKNNWNGLLKE